MKLADDSIPYKRRARFSRLPSPATFLAAVRSSNYVHNRMNGKNI